MCNCLLGQMSVPILPCDDHPFILSLTYLFFTCMFAYQIVPVVLCILHLNDLVKFSLLRLTYPKLLYPVRFAPLWLSVDLCTYFFCCVLNVVPSYLHDMEQPQPHFLFLICEVVIGACDCPLSSVYKDGLSILSSSTPFPIFFFQLDIHLTFFVMPPRKNAAASKASTATP